MYLSGLHDLEGAMGRVEELDLADAPLRHGVKRRAAPAPLQQADGLRCETKEKGFNFCERDDNSVK